MSNFLGEIDGTCARCGCVHVDACPPSPTSLAQLFGGDERAGKLLGGMLLAAFGATPDARRAGDMLLADYCYDIARDVRASHDPHDKDPT